MNYIHISKPMMSKRWIFFMGKVHYGFFEKPQLKWMILTDEEIGQLLGGN